MAETKKKKETVKMEFANTDWHAVDWIADLRKAAKSASFHLLSKHEVELETPRIIDGSQVVVDIHIPEEIAETFAVGPHLRGVAAYLMKYCNGRYDKAVVGNRLLTYTVIPTPETESEQIPMVQRLTIISEMAELLKHTDSAANDKITRIDAILHE